VRFKEFNDLEVIDLIMLPGENKECEVLREGKWVRGRFDRNIRIDQPTHGVGQTHAHIYGRKGDVIGVVNFDGTGSHGTQVRLHKQDADELRGRGFKINSDNIVEWLELAEQPGQLLLLG